MTGYLLAPRVRHIVAAERLVVNEEKDACAAPNSRQTVETGKSWSTVARTSRVL